MTERIRFKGLDSQDPFAFKVYDPDRLVLGKRMEDQLRIAVCYWHSFAWPGTTCSARDLRPALDRRPATRWTARARQADRRVRVLREARRPVLLLPRPRHRARGRDASTRRRPTSTASSTRPPARRSGPASACCGAPPTCSATRATRRAPPPTPIPRCSPTPRRRSSTCSRRRTASAATNYVLWGGREGYETLLNTDLGREERSARPVPAPGRRAQAQDRLRGHAAHRAQAAGADQAPVRLRHRDGPRLPGRYGLEDEYKVNIEANHATLAGHSFHHEVAYAIANGIFGSIDANRGDYQNGWDTDQFPNSVDELVAGALRDPARRRLRDRRLQLRRQAAPPEHRPRRPVPRPHRRHRHARPRAARRRRHDRARDARSAARGSATPAGTASWAAAILAGRRLARGRWPPASPPARSTRGRVSGRQELLENLVTSASGRRRRADARMALRPRDRRLDDRDQGRPHRRGRRGRRRSASPSTTSTSRARCGASRTRRCGGTARMQAIRAVAGRDRRHRRRRRGRRAHRPDARPRAARRRRTASCARRSCGTTSAPARVRRDPRARSGPSG